MQSLTSSTALMLYQPPALQLVQSPKSLVIVDSAVKNYAVVVHRLDAAAVLLMLDADQDGIGQISSYLESCADLERMHILAPSCPGVVKLGRICLNAAALEAYRTQIQAWQRALSPKAQILLHGHNLAIGTAGMALVGRLSQLTGAVVAASSLPVSRRAAQPEFVPLAG